MAVMGLGIAGVWTRDIVAADQLDIAAGRLRAREPGAGSFLLPHWIAEFGTAGLLLAGSIGLLAEAGWALALSLVALGALVYTSTNSLGWALAERARLPYAAPMAMGAVGGVAAIIGLFVI
jgi:hypothetical protein